MVRPAGRTLLEVKVLYGPDTGNRWLHGKGGRGDWASEGSRRQSAGATNRKRMEAALRGEQAKRCKARYVYGTRRRISDAHKRDRGCAIPGEIWRSALCYRH